MAGGREWDAVIAGAGPGGAGTAALLAERGARVLLLDRAEFPRDKACGGGLTPRGVAALRRIGVDPDGAAFTPVSGVHMTGGAWSSTVRFPETAAWPDRGAVVRRDDLDEAVVRRATSLGADLWERVRVLGPIIEDGACRGVSAIRDGKRIGIRAHHTIAADGATSVVARGAGLAPSAAEGGFWYAALRGYFDDVEPMLEDGTPVLEFYPLRSADGRWLPAYGWVFPLPGNRANVGVDLPHRPRHAPTPALRAAYQDFVAWLRARRPGFAAATSQDEPVGALLPEAMAGIRPSTAGLISVGDAAGLITPYSGEGIAYALESADVAATVIGDGGSPRAVADAYAQILQERYGFHFTTALWFMKAARVPAVAGLFARIGIGRPRVLRGAVRIMANLIEPGPGSEVSQAYFAGKRVLEATVLRRSRPRRRSGLRSGPRAPR